MPNQHLQHTIDRARANVEAARRFIDKYDPQDGGLSITEEKVMYCVIVLWIEQRPSLSEFGKMFGINGWKRRKSSAYMGFNDWEKTVDGVHVVLMRAETNTADETPVPATAFPDANTQPRQSASDDVIF